MPAPLLASAPDSGDDTRLEHKPQQEDHGGGEMIEPSCHEAELCHHVDAGNSTDSAPSHAGRGTGHHEQPVVIVTPEDQAGQNAHEQQDLSCLTQHRS